MKYRLILAAPVAALILASCASEVEVSGPEIYGLGFSASVEQLESKGEFVNTGGESKPLSDFSSAVSEFYLSGWDEDDGVFIPADTPISYDNTLSQWTAADRYLWPAGMTATFFAYANLPESGTTVSNTAEAQTVQYVAPASAAEQTDILLGFCRHSATSSATAVADIIFRHPLAAVVFKKGVMDGVADILSILVSGIPGGGTLEVSADDPQNFVWQVSGYSSSASQTNPEGIAVDADSRLGDPFFLLPQNLENHPLKVDVVAELISGATKVMTLQIASGSLQPGVTTVYTLSLDANIFGVSVQSSVSESSVSNVKATLMGNKSAFVRAAITGNWVDETGAVVDGWLVENASSSFVGLAGANWTKNSSDGFWYYTQSVNSSTEISNLFTSFSKPVSRSDGSHFELDVLVQAVEAAGGKTWNNAFAN